MTYLRSLIVILAMAWTFGAWATEGDVARGQILSENCVACHGAEGQSLAPMYPNLAGQHQDYLYNALVEYKKGADGQRNNPIMLGMTATLSEQDMADLAAYYASQKPAEGQADAALVARGAQIYRGGLPKNGVPACSGCHGPKGEGNELAAFPALSGQNADYVLAQLQAFREGTRGGGQNNMMSGVAANMTTEDMKAVASYIAGLH